MTTTTDDLDAEVAAPAERSRLSIILIVIASVAALLIAGTLGWITGGDGDSTVKIAASSVDAGFARDMSIHHTQAVTMAGYERDFSSSPALKILAFDIETSQETEIGRMQGWLDSWGLTRQSSIAPMAWMGTPLSSIQQMPGLASPAQINKLETLRGKPLDILFLQLMIRHHQGGLRMATYAADHAKESYVRQLAGNMVVNQNNEIIEMEQYLRQLGGKPLSAVK